MMQNDVCFFLDFFEMLLTPVEHGTDFTHDAVALVILVFVTRSCRFFAS